MSQLVYLYSKATGRKSKQLSPIEWKQLENMSLKLQCHVSERYWSTLKEGTLKTPASLITFRYGVDCVLSGVHLRLTSNQSLTPGPSSRA